MDNYLSLKDHVYNYLSDRINKGELRPNDRVSELKVSAELGISRTPVREALIQLTSDGYLDNVPRKGFRVKSLEVEKVRDLYEIIGILDGKAAASCIGLLTEAEFQRMEQLIEEMAQAIDREDGQTYYETQIEFHDIYLNKSPNRQIPELLIQLKKNFIRKYYVFAEGEDEMAVLHHANEQHKTILRLFREQRGAELEAFVRDEHWDPGKAQLDSLE